MNLILTAMLFLLPLMLPRKGIAFPGLHTGLWISLFFWGRVNPILSVFVFLCALLYARVFHEEVSRSWYTSYHRLHWNLPYRPQLVLFISALMMFCALAQVIPAYGQFLRLEENLQLQANVLGFVASLLGPILFGFLNDKRGPFPAMITLILTAALSIAMIAYSSITPKLFFYGEGLLWLSISGAFLLLPIFMEHCLGRPVLRQAIPHYILLLTSLWGFLHYTISTDTDIIEHSAKFLLFSVVLLLTAALFSFLAWKNRLRIIENPS